MMTHREFITLLGRRQLGRSRDARSSRPYRLLAFSAVGPPAPQATSWLHSARA